jgi:hypothetical protein
MEVDVSAGLRYQELVLLSSGGSWGRFEEGVALDVDMVINDPVDHGRLVNGTSLAEREKA